MALMDPLGDTQNRKTMNTFLLRNKIRTLLAALVLLTSALSLTSKPSAAQGANGRIGRNSGDAPSDNAPGKAVRKGTLQIKGTPDKVKECYVYKAFLSHDAALYHSAYVRPSVSNFDLEDSISEPYTIGTQYNKKEPPDRGATTLTEKKFKWIAKYRVAAQSGRSSDARDWGNNRPWGGANVMWDSENSNRTRFSADTSIRTANYTVVLGPFGEFSLPLTPNNEDTGLVVSKEIFPSTQSQSSSSEIEPVEQRNFARIRVAAVIKGDAGWDGDLEVLAKVKVYASPTSNVDGWPQYTVKEAFVYPNAIR